MPAPTEAATINSAAAPAATIALRCTIGGAASAVAAGAGTLSGGAGVSAGGSKRSSNGFGSAAVGTNLLPHFGHLTRWPSATGLLIFNVLWQSGQFTVSGDMRPCSLLFCAMPGRRDHGYSKNGCP